MAATTTRTAQGWRLLLATAVLGLAGGAAQVAQAMPGGPGGHGMDRGPGMMMGHGMGAGLHGRALEAVGATEEQRTRIHDIMRAARDDLRKQREAGGDLHAQMAQLLSAPTIDARAVETLRQKLMAQHDAASKRMAQAMLDAAAVLSPEQRQKLADQMAKRRELMERHRRERDAMEGAGRR